MVAFEKASNNVSYRTAFGPIGLKHLFYLFSEMQV